MSGDHFQNEAAAIDRHAIRTGAEPPGAERYHRERAGEAELQTKMQSRLERYGDDGAGKSRVVGSDENGGLMVEQRRRKDHHAGFGDIHERNAFRIAHRDIAELQIERCAAAFAITFPDQICLIHVHADPLAGGGSGEPGGEFGNLQRPLGETKSE